MSDSALSKWHFTYARGCWRIANTKKSWRDCSHYIYDPREGKVWRCEKGKDERRWVYDCSPGLSPQAIAARIIDNDIRTQPASKGRRCREEYYAKVKWSREYAGMSILVLLAAKPKMSYAEILNVLRNEGGDVDGEGRIVSG